MLEFIAENWGIIFSGVGTAAVAGVFGLVLRRRGKSGSTSKQKANAGEGSTIIQGGRDVALGGRNETRLTNEIEAKQSAKGGDNSTIIQGGRDVNISIPKHPPNIKLVRIDIDEDHEYGTLRQKLNIILKNNGDLTAFLNKGTLYSTGSATIRLCNQIGMKFSLAIADWTYDLDISEPCPSFVGRHSIAPNEVINFEIMVGRKEGGHEPTVYRTILYFEFDEGGELVTDPFHLMISGPVVWQGGFQAGGPSPEEWGACQADNITRLAAIGFDYRSFINEDSRKYVEAIEPGIFDNEID